MINHLIEIRSRLLQTLVIFVGFFILFFCMSSQLLQILITPLLRILSRDTPLIITQITSAFFTPTKLAVDAAILATTPIALIHAWRFIAPGLYTRERKPVRWALGCSLLLFVTGVLFCFYLVLPFMLQFFVQSAPPGTHLMPDIIPTVDFITHMLWVFGLCFQIPMVCAVAVRMRLISFTSLKNLRPYAIVCAFVLGMLLTPPDVFSQVLLAVPLCLLYELGIVLALFLNKLPLKKECVNLGEHLQ